MKPTATVDFRLNTLLFIIITPKTAIELFNGIALLMA